MNRSRTNTGRTALLASLVVVVATSAGCGSDDGGANADAAYCDSLVEVRDAFESYADVDIVEGGLSSVRTYVDRIEASLADARAANSERIGDEADAFRTALDDLVETLTSGELPVDRRDEVRAAADEVRRTWDDLVAASEVDCPDVAG